MDAHNIDIKQQVSVTTLVTIANEIVHDISQKSTDSASQSSEPVQAGRSLQEFSITEDLKNDILALTDLTALIDQTPIADFTKLIPWDSVGKLWEAVGLEQFIPLAEVKAVAEKIEETL